MEPLTNQNPVYPRPDLQQNELWRYVKGLESETVARLSQPTSDDVLQLMEQNIQGVLGTLPEGPFNVMITTDRDHLARLMVSAMLNGYFIKTAEQRFNLEKQIASAANSDA
jgi:hypothetical protein